MDWLVNYYPESGSGGKTFDDWVIELNDSLKGKLFFVEIGAMDGVNHDSLNKHIVANSNWSGVLVEPLPDMFAKLKQNYKGRKFKFECAAITEKNGNAEISRIPLEKVNRETPYWADGISTLKPGQHIISQTAELKPHIVKEKIKTMTFKSLADKHKVKSIDLLQIDTEGYDLEVFNQIWTLNFRPKLIKLEINYMTYKDIKGLRWMLDEQGYTTFYEGDDMVAAKL